MLSLLADLPDPEVNDLELEERSVRISDALDHWFQRGLDDFTPGVDVEVVIGHLNTGGHPRLAQAFREGWEMAAHKEALA